MNKRWIIYYGYDTEEITVFESGRATYRRKGPKPTVTTPGAALHIVAERTAQWLAGPERYWDGTVRVSTQVHKISVTEW